MSLPAKTISPAARKLAWVISVSVIAYGGFLVTQAYAPGLFTRFGYAPPLFGSEARAYGLVVVLLGCFPLLLLCRTHRQVAVWGSLLGILLVIAIFALAYWRPER